MKPHHKVYLEHLAHQAQILEQERMRELAILEREKRKIKKKLVSKKPLD